MIRRLSLPSLILLLATALRLYHLDFRALWWDEGLSLFFARLNYIENARMAVILADTNPPVYRLLLGAWVGMVGSSAFTTRLFSVLPGVILVAIVHRLGRALRLSRTTSLMAMVLCAASPMLIYYSQEAKGYSLVAMAAAASVMLWIIVTPTLTLPRRKNTDRGGDRLPSPAKRGRGWGWGMAGLYTLALLLAVGSHYIAAFLIAVENLWTIALTIRHWRGNERQWLILWARMIGAQAIVALALLPFVALTFGGTSAAVRGETGGFSGLNGPAQFFGQHAIELTQGPTAGGVWAWVGAGAIIGLVVIGYWRLEIRDWKLLTWIAIPILCGFALNTYHEFFFPRFVLYTVPPIMLLAANGLHRLASPFAIRHSSFIIVSLFIVSLWTPSLLAHYNAPTDPAEDWRPVAEAMRPLMRERDAAIYVWGWMPGYLDSYLPPAPRPRYALGFFTPQSLDADMTRITAGRDRVWLLDYQIDQFDARNMAGRWLGQRAALVFDEWHGNAHIALFALKQSRTISPGQFEFEFGNGLRLTVSEMQAALAPGDALAISMVWEATRPLAERYTVFLHLQADDGTLVAGRDSEPNNGLMPIAEWEPGERHAELRGLLIPPETPPGRYWITVGMYNTLTGAVDEAGPMVVGAVEVNSGHSTP
ncbi:MAG: hypothetical protein FJ030_00680 [Chloroflexi bacterium]|nr:hypothetical protein [Chloroflexota bacterium]